MKDLIRRGHLEGAVDALLVCASRSLSNLIYRAHGPIGAPLGPCRKAGVLPAPGPKKPGWTDARAPMPDQGTRR